MRSFGFPKRKVLTVLACVLAAAGMFAAVNSPAIVGAAATTRQLPIYRVQRDQKMLSISFDAAWGDVSARHWPSRKNLLLSGADVHRPPPMCPHPFRHNHMTAGRY